MKSLSSSVALSEALMPSDMHGVRIENTDEELGDGDSSKNRLLRPDMPHFTCRPVAMTAAVAGDCRRLVVVPDDSVTLVGDTIDHLRNVVGFDHLISRDDIIGVQCGPTGTLIDNLLDEEDHPLHATLRAKPHALSLTMHSGQTECLQFMHPNLTVSGNIRLSETLNNKALADGVCRRIGIPVARTETAFSRAEAERAYERLKQDSKPPFFIKGARSASAFGLVRVSNDDEFAAALDSMALYFEPGRSPVIGLTPDDALGIVMQESVPHETSLGATMIVGDTAEDDIFVALTQQEFSSGFAHSGSVHDPHDAVAPSVEASVRSSMSKAADYVRRHGGAGTVLSADFVVPTDDPRKDIPHLVEFNMRKSAPFGGYEAVHALTGTSMPSGFAYHIGDLKLEQPLNADDPVGNFADIAGHANLALTRDVRTGEIRPGFLPISFAVRDRVYGVTLAPTSAQVRSVRDELLALL